ncbi:hypothetical protein [Paracidovorax avenae]|uniref:hypothetical protein n=1 Tax=Paracidovorax avenae TaxID=80867 RepID=UPI001260255A|nr:hypothetical protein [Paracidovorax avenae]
MRCANALGKALRTRLNEILEEAGTLSLDEIKRNDGLKSNILTDPLFSLEIISGDSFKITANPNDICRSILRDYYYGHERLMSQWESTSLLVREQKTAWALVSAYYCSFFGAIEALRIFGNHALSLTKQEADAIFRPAGGQFFSKIVEKRNFRGVISADFSEIGYTSTGDKPHQAAWKQLNEKVLSFIPSSSNAWSDVLKFSNMCAGKGGWESPSDIRNRWNYRDSIYFSTLGNNSQNPFLKIIQEEEVASSWIRGQFSIRSENDSAASIAALAKLMHSAMKDSYDFGFLSAKTISS